MENREYPLGLKTRVNAQFFGVVVAEMFQVLAGIPRFHCNVALSFFFEFAKNLKFSALQHTSAM